MKYEGIVYRPPSEAYSLIIQVTIGCAHNKCTFCSMYKDKNFKIRSLQDIFSDLYEARADYSKVKRIFLADGDALVLKTEMLIAILTKIRELFPECERVSAYAAPRDVLNKSHNELVDLKSFGLDMLYMGIESGSDLILDEIQKGVSSKQIIEAGRMVRFAGMKLSVTLISGIGGIEKWKEHAIASAKVINEIKPNYLGLLTLMVEPRTKLYKQVNCGDFVILDPRNVMEETRELIKNIDIPECVFRSNHASNYIAINGTLPYDKQKLLNMLDEVLTGDFVYKDEVFRSL